MIEDRRVLTMGTFDGMHPGHIGLLRRCRAIAGHWGKVIATANADYFVQKFKKVRPIFSVDERLIMLMGCRYVDEAYVNGGDNQTAVIEEMLPNGGFLVIGEDWANRDYLKQLDIPNQEWLDSRNIELLYVPRTGEWSTTELRERL